MRLNFDGVQIIAFIVGSILISSKVECNQKLIKERQMLNKILDPNNYDKRIRAYGNTDSEPTIVTVNLFVRSIDSFDDKNMEYKTQLTFRQQWLDTRLAWNSADSRTNMSYLTMTDISQIWTPDLFFSNEKEGHLHTMLMPNSYVRISQDGNVLVSQRLTLKLSCPMILKDFPMDKQTCSIRMASYGWTTNDLIFKWKQQDPVQVTSNLHLPRFSLEQFSTDYCDSKTNTGTYSCIRLDFLFSREFSHYLVQFYIPSTMLVIVAWMSFWICPKKVVARIIVTLMTLLVQAVQTQEFNAHLPPVSYTKSIDVWNGICRTFVFFTFVEFIVVHYLGRWEKNSSDENDGKVCNNQGSGFLKKIIKSSPTLSGSIDVLSRIAYAFLFLFFNIVYWSVY